MANGSDKTREISLGEEFCDVAMSVNGVRVVVHPDGKVDVFTNGPVQMHPAADGGDAARRDGPPVPAGAARAAGPGDAKPGRAAPTTPKPGDQMADGTLYAGISPDTGQAMYVMPQDAPMTVTFNQALKYAEKFDANGHHDWRIPSPAELNELFKNHAAIGGFDETDAGWYWTSRYDFRDRTQKGWAQAQRFSDGKPDGYDWNNDSHLRLVR